MAYRHPYNRALQPDAFTRPPMPQWLSKPDNEGKIWTRYWTKMYWATLPSLTDQQVAQMKAIHKARRPGENVDHVVPLSSPLVCGLNVPWNLAVIGAKENGRKSNNWWPGMPYQQLDLFDPFHQNPFELTGETR